MELWADSWYYSEIKLLSLSKIEKYFFQNNYFLDARLIEHT
jgi:hypothetical protein